MNGSLKIVISTLLVALVVVSLALYLSQQPRKFRIHVHSGGRGVGEDIYVTAILNCSLPKVPTDIPILEVVRHNYTEDEAIAIAREFFNLTGELNVTRPFNGTTLFVTNDTHRILLYDDGALEYHISSSEIFTRESEFIGKLPEFSEAKEIADKFVNQFIQKAKDHKLINSFPLMQIEFSRVDFCEWYGEPPQNIKPITIGVYYRVMYNGIPLIFKGGIRVEIMKGGKITWFDVWWRDVKLGEPIPISVSPEQAIENMDIKLPINTSANEIKSLYIDSVTFGYFTPAPSPLEHERFTSFLPAYEVTFHAILKDGSEYDDIEYVSATSLSIPL